MADSKIENIVSAVLISIALMAILYIVFFQA